MFSHDSTLIYMQSLVIYKFNCALIAWLLIHKKRSFNLQISSLESTLSCPLSKTCPLQLLHCPSSAWGCALERWHAWQWPYAWHFSLAVTLLYLAAGPHWSPAAHFAFQYVYNIAISMSYANSCINPFIYIVLSETCKSRSVLSLSYPTGLAELPLHWLMILWVWGQHQTAFIYLTCTHQGNSFNMYCSKTFTSWNKQENGNDWLMKKQGRSWSRATW